jgi:MFS family permease
MISYLWTVRRFSRDVRLLLIVPALLGFTLFGGITAVLLNLYLLRLGYGPQTVGLVNSVGPLLLASFALPAAGLGRRFGLRRPMALGLITLAAGQFLLALAEIVPAPARLGWLMGTYGLAHLGLAVYLVNGSPFVMAVTGEEERNHVYSTQAALTPLAAFVGSLAGGFLPGLFGSLLSVPLDQPAPYRYALLVSATLAAPAALAVLATREPPLQPRARSKAGGDGSPLGLIVFLSVVIFAQGASEGSARSFFNVYLDAGLHVPTARIGALAAGGQLLAVPAALMTPVLANRWGNGRAYVAAALGMGLSMLPLALIPDWRVGGLGFVGVMAAAAIARPCVLVYQMEIVTAHWRPWMAGATTIGFGLSMVVASLAGGVVIESLGYRPLFLGAACLTVAGGLLFWGVFRIPRGEYGRGLAPASRGDTGGR